MAQSKRLEFKPQDLEIVWSNDPRYWNIPKKDSVEAAELLQVSWLEVSGVSGDVDVSKEYEISFEIGMKEDCFGWLGTPLYVMAKAGRKGPYTREKVELSNAKSDKNEIPKPKVRVKFNKAIENNDAKIYFGLYEVWSGKWKKGLLIYGAKVQEASA